MRHLKNEIRMAIRNVVGHSEIVPLHEPSFEYQDGEHVAKIIRSGWVSSVGNQIKKLEEELCSYLGGQLVTAVNSGTSALHLSLKVSGVGSNTEVFCPSISFVATSNVIHYCGATPHFIDVNLRDFCVCIEKLEEYVVSKLDVKNGRIFNPITGNPVVAMIAVHVFGMSPNLPALIGFCKKYNITLIEDAACALGSKFNSVNTGSKSKLAIFSFNGNKIITGGNGGAIATNNRELHQKIRHLSTTAKISNDWEFDHDAVGYNYRLSNISSALLRTQLQHIEKKIECKRVLNQQYTEAFKKIDEIKMISEIPPCFSNYWLNSFKLVKGKSLRDEILTELNEAGIMSRPIWKPLHLLPMNKNCPRANLDNSLVAHRSLVSIPSSPHLANNYDKNDFVNSNLDS